MDTKWPIGVFASIDAGLGVRLEVAHELGVRTIHLHTPHAASRTPQRAAEFNRRLAELGITITCVFAGFEGESYADIPTVERTVGLMPRETRAARTAELKEIADFARELNVDVVGIHLGFVPHDKSDADYRELLEITRDVCDHCKRNRQALHLETGQEPVDVLIEFLDDVKRDNLFVNFDPANMILYGAGEPIPGPRAAWPARSQHPLQRRHLVGPTRRNLGPRGAARRGRCELRSLLANAQPDRLHRPIDDRTRNPPGARTPESRNWPGDRTARAIEAANQVGPPSRGGLKPDKETRRRGDKEIRFPTAFSLSPPLELPFNATHSASLKTQANPCSSAPVYR